MGVIKSEHPRKNNPKSHRKVETKNEYSRSRKPNSDHAEKNVTDSKRKHRQTEHRGKERSSSLQEIVIHSMEDIKNDPPRVKIVESEPRTACSLKVVFLIVILIISCAAAIIYARIQNERNSRPRSTRDFRKRFKMLGVLL